MVLYCDATNVQGNVSALRLTTPTKASVLWLPHESEGRRHKNPLTRSRRKAHRHNARRYRRKARAHTREQIGPDLHRSRVTGPQAINQVLRRKHARNAISSQQDCTKRRHQQAPHAKPSASVTTTE